MGEMLRRHWIPACMSEELPEPDGAPIRLRLLGENLVAFRDSNGRVGILDENCPHRGISLSLARNEECGLRCIYHGWKMDVDGNILEMPTEPELTSFAEKVKAPSYPTQERGGLIWTYMGPPGREPPFRDFSWTKSSTHRAILKYVIRANFVQAIENLADTAHIGILHGMLLASDRKADLVIPSADIAPDVQIADTAFGYYYAGLRKPVTNPESTRYVRVTAFVAPFYSFVPDPKYGTCSFYVPVDDHTSAGYNVRYHPEEEVDERSVRDLLGLQVGQSLDRGSQFLGTRANHWRQDRNLMDQWPRTQSADTFSGIVGLHPQDLSVIEAMGAIADRSKVRPAASDKVVVHLWNLLLDSVRRVELGEDPIGLEARLNWEGIRGWSGILSRNVPWQSMVADQLELTEHTP
jgi:phthalate 4,5-dioxygenase oxygenase subunit